MINVLEILLHCGTGRFLIPGDRFPLYAHIFEPPFISQGNVSSGTTMNKQTNKLKITQDTEWDKAARLQLGKFTTILVHILE